MDDPAKDPQRAARVIWFDLIADALTFYNRHLPIICTLVLPFSVPTALIRYSGQEGLALVIDTTTAPVYCGALIVYFAGVLKGERPPLMACLAAGFVFWPRLLVATLLVEAVVYCGWMAYVVPGLILTAWFGFYDYLIVLQGCGPLQSLKASFDLARRYTLQITATFAVVFAPIFGLELLIRKVMAPDAPAFLGYLVAADLLKIVVLVLFFRIFCLLVDLQPPAPETDEPSA